ncbi:stage III sporulation protein AF [Symbiobacterium terraclitae]|uniref:stage III sporulation protein AF n=1 Tax=Symbiobacterium terraclitae TaxID=557451 RepID=UPI0035B529DF
MAALIGWVRSLVVLVVLASLLEMLLPTGGMKRFVRLSMGLLILLGVVRPLVSLLGGQAAFDPYLLQEPAGRLPSIDEIMVEANRFQARSQALLLEEVRGRLARQAETAALAVEGVAGADVALELGGGPALETVHVEKVSVTLLLGSRFGQVRPVEPVRIGGAGGQAEEARGGTTVRAPLPEEAPIAEAVRQQVAEQLGIGDPSAVAVWIAGTARPGR